VGAEAIVLAFGRSASGVRAFLLVVIWVVLSAACSEAQEVTLLSDLIVVPEVPPSPRSSEPAIRVQRFDLDVTKDGRPEVFLATTYLAGSFGNEWAVYTSDGNGNYRRLATLTFHYDGFYYSPEQDRFSVYVRVSSQTGGFTRYLPTSTGFAELAEAYGSVEQEQARVEAWQHEGRPPLYETTLDGLRGAGTFEWKDADTGEANPFLGRLSEPVVQ